MNTNASPVQLGVVRNAPETTGPLALLATGIPLTLLLDLLDPRGPDSRAIYRSEAADLSWMRSTRAAA